MVTHLLDIEYENNKTPYFFFVKIDLLLGVLFPLKRLGMYCFKCNEMARLECSKCATPYCSKSCQIQAWEIHKNYCGKEPIYRIIQYFEDTKTETQKPQVVIYKSVQIIKLNKNLQMNIQYEYLYKTTKKKSECCKVLPWTPYPSDSFGFKFHYCQCIKKVYKLRDINPHKLCKLYHVKGRCPLVKSFLLVMYRYGVAKDIRKIIFDHLDPLFPISTYTFNLNPDNHQPSGHSNATNFWGDRIYPNTPTEQLNVDWSKIADIVNIENIHTTTYSSIIENMDLDNL